MVLDEFGHIPGYREVTGTPREPYGPSWALVERRKGQPKGAARLPPSLVGVGEEGRGRGREGKGVWAPSQFGLGLGGAPTSWPPPLSYTKAHVGPLNPRGVPVTPPVLLYMLGLIQNHPGVQT